MDNKYIRIIGQKVNNIHVIRHVGSVGIVIGSEDRADGNGMMFNIKIGRFLYLFHEWNIQFITKKEYFKGCLSG